MKIKFTLFFFLFQLICFSQTKVYTLIEESKSEYKTKNFTFERVIDARKNKDNIGIVHKSNSKENYLADFSEKLPKEFFNFLINTFTNKSAGNKILFVVNYFEIGHIITGGKKDTGFVKVNFDFYKLQHDSAIFIFNYYNRLFDFSDNTAITHSNRINRITLKAVAMLDSILSENKSIILKGRLISDSLKKVITVYPEIGTNQPYIYTPNLPRRFMLLAGGHAMFGITANLFGGNLSFVRQFKKHPKFYLV